MDMNTTLEATLEDDTSIVIRQRHTYPSDPIFEQWSQTKFENEVSLLRWLKSHSPLRLRGLVPAILGTGKDFMVQEKMSGSPLALEWHFWSDTAKERFMSLYIDVVLELFHLPVEHCIGSAKVEDDGTATIDVGPRIGPNPSYSSSAVFDSMTQYLHFFIATKRLVIDRMEGIHHERASQNLSFIEEKIPSLLQKITDTTLLTRNALTHGDLHTYNILVDKEGRMTALLDWEVNSIQPALLAIDYPAWLSDRGPYDPRFASNTYWWDESPAERKRLCLEFERILRERDGEAYECLLERRDLRAVVAWLTDTAPDLGFDRMRAWADAELE